MLSKLATRHQLSLIASFGVFAAMLAALIAFNAFEGWQIREEAVASVDEAVGWESQDGSPATRVANYIWLDSGLELMAVEGMPYAELESALAQWCVQHFSLNEPMRVELLGHVCYVEMAKDDWDDRNTQYAIAYVDVTSQYQLVGSISAVMAVIALVGGVAAGFAGWRVGSRIEAAEKAQKRFYENMSHELKTPLAAIRGYAEGLGTGLVEPDHAATAIVRETDRMTTLVDQILSLSRLEAGAVKLNLESLEVQDFVQDCLMPFEGMVRTRGLDVELDLAPGTLRMDEELASHALENVLSNAVRHASTIIRVGFDGRELWVENDGALPDEREVAYLFERFRTGEGGSTGIGLALAKEIATLHGWQLRADVREGLIRMTFVVGSDDEPSARAR